MFEGLIKLAGSAGIQGFNKPDLKKLVSNVRSPKDAQSVMNQYYKQHPGEQNRQYRTPSGKMSTGNPYLKGIKMWANEGKDNRISTMRSQNKQYNELANDMKMYGS